MDYDYLGAAVEIHAHADGTVEMLCRIDVTHEEGIKLLKACIANDEKMKSKK